MASLQKFSRLGYRIYWRLYLPNGIYKEKYKASKSKTILRETLPDIMKLETLSRRNELSGQDLLRALNLGIITRDEMQLFSTHIDIPEDHYLSELRADFETKSKAESSDLHSHMANLAKANVLERYFDKMPLRQITTEALEQFRADRKKTVTNTTINHDLKILRKYLDIAISKGYIRANPARTLKLLSEPKARIPRCLYPDEIKKLFQALPKFGHLLYGEFEFIFLSLIHTGLRRSELCNLKPENVKLHLRQIHVMGKGKRTRVVGIHKSLLKAFKTRVERGYILPPNIHPTSITRALKKVFRQLDLHESLTLHSLRHTYISYLLEKGVPTKKVKELAGHFSLTVTDRYTHALPSNKVTEDVLDFNEGIAKVSPHSNS
jgi:site-specific recombinase XerD